MSKHLWACKVVDSNNFITPVSYTHLGQPDFAKITINYIPNVKMVESKSLKLYLFSFRNQGDFHEDCINIIMKDLVKLMEPKYLEVKGIFTPRGGISIYPFANYGQPGTKYEKIAENRLFDSLK